MSGQGSLGVMRAGEVSVASGARGMIMQQRLTNMDAAGYVAGLDWEFELFIFLGEYHLIQARQWNFESNYQSIFYI